MTSTSPPLTLSNTAQAAISNTSVVVDSYYLFNPNANVAYVQMFDRNTPSNVIVGTTQPLWSPGIPAGSAANLADLGLGPFANGLMVAVTTTANGTTALPSALTGSFSFR